METDMRKAFQVKPSASSRGVTRRVQRRTINRITRPRSDGNTGSQAECYEEETVLKSHSQEYSQESNSEAYVRLAVEKAYDIIESALFHKVPVTQKSSTYDESLDPPCMRNAKGPNQLFSYQKDAVARLREFESKFQGGICADDIGLGKTIVSIALSESRTMDAPELIVAPRSVMRNWDNEFKAWLSPAPKVLFYDDKAKDVSVSDLESYDKIIVSYDRVRIQFKAFCDWVPDCSYRRQNPTAKYRAFTKGTRVIKEYKVEMKLKHPNLSLFLMRWGRIIFDEVHIIKNPKTSIARACCLLKAETRLLLTGTPFGNDYADIQSLFKLLRLEPFSQKTFFDAYFKNKVKGGKRRRDDDIRVRPHENPRLESERNAFLALALDAVTLRRHRLGIFNGKPILKDIPIPAIQRIDLLLNDGKKYDYIIQYACRAKEGDPGSSPALIAFRKFLNDPENVNPSTLWDPSIDSQTFVPQNEQERQFITRFQWCNRLRDWSVYADVTVKNENLLEDMTFAVMSACHWALPGAHYGDIQANTLLDPAVDSKNMSQAGSNVFKKNSKTSGQKFQDFISEGDHWRSTKIDFCIDLAHERLREAPSEGILIFSSFLAALDIVQVGLLKQYNIRVPRLDGTVSHERIPVVRRKATTVIILNPEWTPAREEQSWGRAVRIGQAKTVTVYLLRAVNSMDDRCLVKQDLKTSKKSGLLNLEMINGEDRALNVSPSDEDFRKRTRDTVKKLRTLNKKRIVAMFEGIYVEGTNIESGRLDDALLIPGGSDTNDPWFGIRESVMQGSNRPIIVSSSGEGFSGYEN